MKFNTKNNEKQRLLELINKSHQNKFLELEAIVYNQGLEKTILYDDFISCLKRVKNQKEYKSYPSVELLNINFKLDSKYKNIRVTITGKETIKYFCAHGKLVELGSNVKYFYKETITDETGKPARVNMDDYNIRFNLKEEREIDVRDDLVRDLLQHWMETPKWFRYKKTFTFETVDGLFKNDFSIVRESLNEDKEMSVADVRKFGLEDKVIQPKDANFNKDFKNFGEWWFKMKNKPNSMVMVKDQPTHYQSFQKSGTLENKSLYEIEVEYLGNQKQQKTVSNMDVLIKFIEVIGVNLQALQKSYFVISRTEINNVRNTYNSLTGVRGKNSFKASLPNTVEISHLQQLTNRQYLDPSNTNLRKNFLVTEKADGERNLLYIDPTGEFYFINRQNLIRKMGLKMTELANCLIDGEYLDDKETYMIFDIYFFKGIPVWKEIFAPRYEKVKQITEYIKQNMNSGNKPNPLVDVKFNMLIGRKEYERGDNILKTDDLDNSSYDTLIFTACKNILNKVNVKQGGLLQIGHQYSYNIDGLIFIPSNLYVGQDYLGQEIKTFYEASSWGKTYKWKPPVFNSIDMEIEIIHPKSKVDTNDQYYNGLLYRQVIVKVDYQSNFHNIYNSQRVLNEGLGFYDGSIAFTPNYPFIGSMDYNNNLVDETHIAWMPLDNNGNMLTLEKNTVLEGDIIEFTYDLSVENPQHRWKPIRHRAGKKKPNGYHTAINVWRSMHSPISIEMISGSKKIPQADIYYQSYIDKDELYLKEMNKFHNFVKGRLYEHMGREKKNPNILELASGRLGDYFKLAELKPNFVLGVEYSQDNINNIDGGATMRALNTQETNPKYKKFNSNLMVVWGDCSKPINTSEAGMDDLNKYYLKVLYGDVDITDYSKLGKMSGRALQKFDIVSCQFSMHYFFGDYDTLSNFINNVYQNLKTGGYYIGTCLDGKMIHKKLKSTGSGSSSGSGIVEQYQDNEKTKLIWKIERKYEESDFPDNEMSLGRKINVDVESIGTTSHEFLVNFDYFVKLMDEYGLELVDSKLFHEVPNSMLEEFYEEVKLHGNNLRKKPKALEYSVLHRWFIFVKKGLTDTPSKSEGEKNDNELSPLTKDEESEITDPNFKSQKLKNENLKDEKLKNKNRFEWKQEDMLDNVLDSDNPEESDNDNSNNNSDFEEFGDDIEEQSKIFHNDNDEKVNDAKEKVNKVEPRKQQKGGNELIIEELDLESINLS